MTTTIVISLDGSQQIGNLSNPTSSRGQVIQAEFTSTKALPIPNTISLESVIAQFESDREFAQAMSESRKELAQLLYSSETETLAALRLNAGLSQTQLAQLLGTSQSYIARIEAGRVDPGTEMVAKIASVLSIDEEKAFVAIRRQRTRSK